MKKKLTKEEKELVIKDLLPRISTDLLVKVPGEEEPKELRKRVRWMITFGRAKSIEDCLTGLIPYLRPFSDMTEEEMEELKTLCSIYIPTDSPTIGFEDYGIVVFTHHLTTNTYSFKLSLDVIDWLILHHFDFRGLIEKDLAIKAEKGMYNLEKK